ncbi:uncharacterized protein J3D65DRAFT_325738 [Phyllosticta citribraziliensis]|uniref:Uncharacterized protein n=1 Tax=Phyllosticta citribraziliensis TaxID=989973 RepID=A0ABR1LT87_9PEZI
MLSFAKRRMTHHGGVVVWAVFLGQTTTNRELKPGLRGRSAAENGDVPVLWNLSLARALKGCPQLLSEAMGVDSMTRSGDRILLRFSTANLTSGACSAQPSAQSTSSSKKPHRHTSLTATSNGNGALFVGHPTALLSHLCHHLINMAKSKSHADQTKSEFSVSNFSFSLPTVHTAF